MSNQIADPEYYAIYQSRSDGDWELYMVYSRARIEDEPQALDEFKEDLDWKIVEGGDCDFPSIYENILSTSIESFFAKEPRIRNALLYDDVKTVRELVQKDERFLLRLPNFAHKSLVVVINKLHEHNLKLRQQND